MKLLKISDIKNTINLDLFIWNKEWYFNSIKEIETLKKNNLWESSFLKIYILFNKMLITRLIEETESSESWNDLVSNRNYKEDFKDYIKKNDKWIKKYNIQNLLFDLKKEKILNDYNKTSLEQIIMVRNRIIHSPTILCIDDQDVEFIENFFVNIINNCRNNTK